MSTLTSFDEAIAYAQHMLAAHPERDAAAAYRAALAGERRPHAVMAIGHQNVPGDTFAPTGELDLPTVGMGDSRKAGLANEIMGMIAPLKLLNPIRLTFNTGKGPGTLATCFDIPLNPETLDTPAFTKSMDAILDASPPDPRTAGLLTSVHEKIRIVKDMTPPNFKIMRPDTQGPFNIAHAIIGEEALLAPYTEPEKFHRLMTRITEFWIEAVRALREAIGAERCSAEQEHVRICECSCNLISREMYEAFVLPYDLRIADAFGRLDIHTCSGPHVFHETLEGIPNIASTEAGFIARTAAGSTPVDEALEAIKDRPILLQIGQELPEGVELEMIKTDIGRYAGHPRMTFGYSGMHWRKKDRARIREIHQEADAHWQEQQTPPLRTLRGGSRTGARRAAGVLNPVTAP